jgi:PAS domain S-box-containing protein
MRALLVHSPSATRDLIAEVLGSLAWEVTVVPDGDSARSRFATAAFPLILVDDADLEAAAIIRSLREIPLDPLQPIPYLVASTCRTETEAMEALRAAGADQVVPRPLGPGGIREQASAAAQRLGTCPLPPVGLPLHGLEETLRLHTAHLEELFASAPEGIAVLDEVGRVLRINGEFTRMFGYSPREALGRPVDDLTVPIHLRGEAHEILRAVSRGERVARETVRHRADGTTLHVSLLATPIHLRDGKLGSFRIYRDITERKSWERSVRASEERFRQLAENIQAVFYMKDALNTETLYVSPAYETVWGRPVETLYRDPDAWTEPLHPADRARVLANRPISLVAPSDIEYRIVRPEGEVRWVRDRSFPVRDEHGEAYRHAGIAEDVTERRLTEQALRESEERNRALLDALPDLILQLHRDGTVIGYHAGDGTELAPGVEDAIGASIHDLLAAPVADRCLRTVEEAFRTRRVQRFEYEQKVGEGIRVLEARVVVSGADRALVIARDVTEGRRAEVALRESEARYRTLFDQTPVGVFQYDASLRVTGCNAAFVQLVRTPVDRVVGLDLRRLRDPRLIPALEAAVEGGVASYEGEYRAAASGVDLWISAHLSPLRDSSGAVVGGIGVVEDVSERRAAEAEIARVNGELRRRTAEVEEALRARNQFYVSMNHELRTPISAIMLYNELLLTGALGDLPDEQRDAVEQSYKASAHLLELVQDVLDLSKVEAGKMEIRSVDTYLPELLDDLLATVRPLVDSHGVELEVEGSHSVPALFVDPRRLRQILLNLISNAVRFAQRKPVTIRCRELGGGEVGIEVVDRGTGIPPEDMERIFEEFVQATPLGSGTGLGLPISRRLATLMQGRLEAASQPGVGSTFRLVLPLRYRPDSMSL